MTNKIDTLVTVASWEERFLMGTNLIPNYFQVNDAWMFFCKEYAHISHPNRIAVKALLEEKKILLNESQISLLDSLETWKELEKTSVQWKGKSVLVDITTMPRDIIWAIFGFLCHLGAKTSYIYFRPEIYSDWLSRDPGKPRLVYRCSGLAQFDNPTMLFIVTGYDVERTSQLINFYEPGKVVLAVQKGEQFNNISQNAKNHEKLVKYHPKVEFIEFDSYSEDHGFSKVDNLVTKDKNKFNIILSSLGPKPSAVALYRTYKKHPEVALAYAPSNQFNQVYSKGINKDPIIGKI